MTHYSVLDDLDGALAGVEGWLKNDDARWLAFHACRAAQRNPLPMVVEIGSWKGRSTIALALALKSVDRGRVYAIDPHNGEPADPTDTMPEFLRNIERARVTGFVSAIRAFSREPLSRFADRSVDFLFLDGSHDYSEVVRDIAAWEPKLADDAEIAFDDADWLGVNRALYEHVARIGSPFRRPRYLGKILYCTVGRERPWSLGDTVAALRLRVFLRALLIGRFVSPHLHWRVRRVSAFAIRLLLAIRTRRRRGVLVPSEQRF